MFLFTRGSLETVMDMCTNIQLYGYVEDLDIGKQHAIWAVDQSFARERMLSLAFAYRKLEEEPESYTVETVERDLVFVGMMGIADPLRADVNPAVSKCLDGGVETIMLTGDHTSTAFAFAQALDIARDVSETLSGEDLDIMGEKEYSSSAEKFSVYADVSSDQKLRIVRTLRDKDEVIAVIGKDAGDAAAVEEADVGIAAGQNGSSATINAADVVIMDSSFATAVNAIEITQFDFLAFPQRVPVVVTIANVQKCGLPQRLARQQPEILLFEVVYFCVAALCFEQHCKRRILVGCDRPDRVHDDADF